MLKQNTSNFPVIGDIEHRRLRLKVAYQFEKVMVPVLAETFGADVSELLLCIYAVDADFSFLN